MNVLHQLERAWHWFTYGQNAEGVGVICATAVGITSIVVLIYTLVAVNRQAAAATAQAEAARKQTEVSEQLRVVAERSASAAEEQVAAAKSSADASDAQRRATEASAAAERAHSELIRHQLLASLRPVLILTRRPNALHQWDYFVENHGQGIAIEAAMSYRKSPMDGINLAQTIVGAGRSARAALDERRLMGDSAQINYQAEDGRCFVTIVNLLDQELNQQMFQTDERGGWILPDPIPELN